MEVNRPKNGEIKDSWVLFDNGQGGEIGKLLRLTRHVAVFETYIPSSALQLSQVMADFKILFHGSTIYSGRAVIRGLIHSGVAFICEVTLDDRWLEASVVWPAAPEASGFASFVQSWQRVYKVVPEFKVAVTDLHAFLSDLRLWLDQQELGTGAGLPEEERVRMAGLLREIEEPVMRMIDQLHQRFEEIGDGVPAELRPAHQHFARRHLHPFFLCSPFGHRAYYKPLGYAGDYEMVNMILRPPYEGSSLFARVMNVWLLRQYPSEAHRNRIEYLVNLLTNEALRCQVRGDACRVLSIGCGPAYEIQRFVATSCLADGVRFELVDMNEETLAHTASVLEELKSRHGRRTKVETRKRTVLGLLRDAMRSPGGKVVGQQDLIYCAGLFDYLTDTACQQLLKAGWDWLAPGGMLVVTNVDTFRPFRHMLEFLLDWHLNYRNQAQMRGLVVAEIPAEAVTITSDVTGVNLFLEIRRPTYG